MTPIRRTLAAGVLAAVLVPAAARAQPARPPAGDMTLVLVGDDGTRTAPLKPMVGTVIVTRSDATAPEPPDKLDLVFDTSIWSEPAVLRWLADSGGRASAVFTVEAPGHSRLEYVLTGITARNLTLTEQDGVGQATMVLAAAHVSVGGVAIN